MRVLLLLISVLPLRLLAQDDPNYKAKTLKWNVPTEQFFEAIDIGPIPCHQLITKSHAFAYPSDIVMNVSRGVIPYAGIDSMYIPSNALSLEWQNYKPGQKYYVVPLRVAKEDDTVDESVAYWLVFRAKKAMVPLKTTIEAYDFIAGRSKGWYDIERDKLHTFEKGLYDEGSSTVRWSDSVWIPQSWTTPKWTPYRINMTNEIRSNSLSETVNQPLGRFIFYTTGTYYAYEECELVKMPEDGEKDPLFPSGGIIEANTPASQGCDPSSAINHPDCIGKKVQTHYQAHAWDDFSISKSFTFIPVVGSSILAFTCWNSGLSQCWWDAGLSVAGDAAMVFYIGAGVWTKASLETRKALVYAARAAMTTETALGLFLMANSLTTGQADLAGAYSLVPLMNFIELGYYRNALLAKYRQVNTSCKKPGASAAIAEKTSSASAKQCTDACTPVGQFPVPTIPP